VTPKAEIRPRVAMSAMGQKQTLTLGRTMSALPLKADMQKRVRTFAKAYPPVAAGGVHVAYGVGCDCCAISRISRRGNDDVGQAIT
jgi:hypothetical protein